MKRDIDFIEDPEKIKLSLDETRSKILSLLNINEMTIPNLAEALDKNQSTIYVHLKKLEEADLVDVVEERKKYHIPQKVYGRTSHAFLLVPNEEMGQRLEEIIMSQIDYETLYQLEELGYYNEGYKFLVNEMRDFFFKTNKYINEKFGQKMQEELREELDCTKRIRAKLLLFMLETTSNEYIEDKLTDICSHFKGNEKKRHSTSHDIRAELVSEEDIEIVDDSERLEVLMSPSKQKILSLLDVDDMTITQMSKTLDKHRSTVYRHVRKLQEYGFVEMKSEEIINNTPVQVYGKIADLYVPFQPSLNPEDIENARLRWDEEKGKEILNCLKRFNCKIDDVEGCAERLEKFFDEVSDKFSERLEDCDIEMNSLIKLLALKLTFLFIQMENDSDLRERAEDILSNIKYPA